MMRKNNFYAPVIPTSRNEFVDYVQDSKEVIAVNHELLKSMDVELAENRTKGRVGTVLKTAGAAGLLFCNLLNPVTWILSLATTIDKVRINHNGTCKFMFCNNTEITL